MATSDRTRLPVLLAAGALGYLAVAGWTVRAVRAVWADLDARRWLT